MKKQNVSQLMVITLSLELILSPLAVANAADTPAPSPAKSSAAETALGILSIGAGIMQKVNQTNHKDPNYYSDLAGFTKQQTPQQDKFFSANKLMQLPGLANYLANNKINPTSLNCSTLPTTLHEAEPEECRVGVLSDRDMPPEAQLSKMTAYANQYQQIEKLYKNYTATSNVSGQGFGVGCMKNAMQILQGYFAYRIDELDKLTTNLEAINNQFKEATKSDLNAIEEATAVLEGGNSEIADKVRNSKPDLFDFGSKFNNPACNSMLSGEGFNAIGGLNKINKELKTQLTAKPQGSKFSGDTYLTNHQAVVEDIKKMADNVAKQVELNFTSIVQGKNDGIFNVSANHGLERVLKPSLIADQQLAFQEKNKALQSEISIIAKELGSKGKGLSADVSNPHSGAFASELMAIETSIKNDCLTKSVDIGTVINNTYDATSSSFANQNASSFLKDKLQQIVGNNKTSFSKKIAELQSIEKQYGNYYVKMQNAYEVQEIDSKGNLVSKVVPASNRRTPSAYLSDVIKSCEAQFKSNHLSNQVTGADAIKKLRSIHNEYKSLAKSHANKIKNEINNKLIECRSGVDANTSASASCSPEVFNTGEESFCANAALSCSKNMKACSEQADKFVKEIKTDRTARVNNYKTLVEKNKQDIVKIFDAALSQYMKEGEYLRGLFGTGFTSPKDIMRNADHLGEGKYLSSLAGISSETDGRLLLEDPEKYVEVFKQNIEQLKQSVQQQQDQIINGDQGLLGHIAQTEKNYNDIVKEASKLGGACQKNYDSYVRNIEKVRGQQQKELQELGEKGAEFCNRLAMAQESNDPSCGEDLKDLSKLASKLDPRASAAAIELSKRCSGQNVATVTDPNIACIPYEKNGSTTSGTTASTEAETGKDSSTLAALCTQMYELRKCTRKDDDGKTVACLGTESLETSIKNYLTTNTNPRGSTDVITSDYCSAANGSISSNKTLNFMNSLAKELGVQSAGTRQ